MKKLIVILIFTFSYHLSSSQHYGGIYMAPYSILNNDFGDSGNKSGQKKFTFGYTVGYQGLLRAKKRISFSYGMQYSYQYLENKSYYASGQTTSNVITGRKEELHLLEIPATWRYNLNMGKKWQPYISISTTAVIPVAQKAYSISDDGEYSKGDAPNYTPFILPDIGIGINYTSKDWVFNVQPTIRPISIWKKIGIGFSVMRKF